jgi:type I restriction enzyme, S subunit
MLTSWETKKIRELFNLGRGRVISSIEIANHSGKYPVYSSQSRDNGCMGYIDTFDFDGEYVTWTTDGANAGTVFYRNGQFNCTNVCGTLKAKNTFEIDPRFTAFQLGQLSKRHVSYIGNPKLMNGVMAEIEVKKPPYPEQKTIAAILDTLDEAIAATEDLMAKQEKMKQGLLQDLLTRGVDENGQLRPHWDERPDLYRRTELGWIPKEWDVDCLGKVCARGDGNVQTGPFGSQLHAEDYQEQGVPIITVEHLSELSISHNNLPLVGKEDYIRLKKYDLRTGDLVFSRVGAIDRCSYVTDKEHGWLFSGRCLRVRAGNAINSKYLAFVLNSFRQRQWIVNSAVGSTMACLNTTILSNVPITVPQSYEQNFVADALFDDFIGENHLKSDLKKLEAIKTGLMQDLLTGRRRVTPELIQQVETLTRSAD